MELDDFVKNLLATLTYVELSVDPKFFKHIIGKNGTNSKSLLRFGFILILNLLRISSLLLIYYNHYS